tara:strand:+ start:260 stop:442 length:183 start_codon:yes stop_codon:yes gene_type:complete
MNWIKNIWNRLSNTEEKLVRTRTAKGRFIADNKSTKNVNEAYKTVKVSKKRGRPAKKKYD